MCMLDLESTKGSEIRKVLMFACGFLSGGIEGQIQYFVIETVSEVRESAYGPHNQDEIGTRILLPPRGVNHTYLSRDFE